MVNSKKDFDRFLDTKKISAKIVSRISSDKLSNDDLTFHLIFCSIWNLVFLVRPGNKKYEENKRKRKHKMFIKTTYSPNFASCHFWLSPKMQLQYPYFLMFLKSMMEDEFRKCFEQGLFINM